MKNKLTVGTSVLVWVFYLIQGAKADVSAMRGQFVEIPVMNVFIPKKGYDDNDHVEAVAYGRLPNPCYSLNANYAEKSPDGKGFIIHQTAYKEEILPCASGGSDHLADPVPFTVSVALGTLGAGDYQLEFAKSPHGGTDPVETSRKTFSIEKASVSTLDNFDYAVVEGIDVDPFQEPNKPVTATISGILTSRCAVFERPMKILREEDVTIILPTLKKVREVCERGETGFREKVELGTYLPGEYLLHVRSRNGKAVNRVFTVVPR